MFTTNNFEKTGVAWPYKLRLLEEIDPERLSEEYFSLQKKADEIFKKKISLKPNLLSTFFDKIVFDENILEQVKKIIGNNIYVWSSAFFSKAPGEGKIVSFHQDNPYWQLTTSKVVTAWVALTKSDENSGALQLVPNSHNLGLINKLDVDNARKSYLKGEKTTPSEDLLSYNQNLHNFVKKNPPKIVKLEPGEFSIHHVNTVHGSDVNKSQNYRIGFAIRYVSSETKHIEETSDTAIHVSGQKNVYYINENRPKSDFSGDAIANYKIAMNSAGAFGNKSY
tara:strand:+ start:1151 stop:1990 length:840 start_codon:yes stop_codon:yes gene_type:complete